MTLISGLKQQVEQIKNNFVESLSRTEVIFYLENFGYPGLSFRTTSELKEILTTEIYFNKKELSNEI